MSDEGRIVIEFRCQECGQRYERGEWGRTLYARRPYRYHEGCRECCLACWLGVGPGNFPDSYRERFH